MKKKMKLVEMGPKNDCSQAILALRIAVQRQYSSNSNNQTEPNESISESWCCAFFGCRSIVHSSISKNTLFDNANY